MASTDAKAFPIKNQAYRVTFPILDADGDPVTGATALDSEVSKDAGTFVDCTNEATEIATASGIYYLDLTATEMNADTVAVQVKTTSSGAKTTVLVFYPLEDADIRVNAVQWAGSATATTNIALMNTLAKASTSGFNDISTANVQTELAAYGALKPTVAARTLDVSAGGEAGLDWANIGAPTTAQNLSATTISASQVVGSVTGAVGSVTGTVTLTAAYDAAKTAATQASVNTISGYVDTEVAAIKAVTDKLDTALELDGAVYRYTTNALEQAPTGGAAADPWATVLPGAYAAGTAGKILGTNLDVLVSSRLAAASYTVPTDPWTVLLPGSYGPGTAGFFVGDRLDNKVSTRMAATDFIGPIPAATIAVACRDVDNTSPAANSLGAGVKAAASAGDPWGTLLPGAYTGGTAGNIIGNFIDVAVSTRMAASSFVTPPTKEVIAVAVRDVNNASPAAGSLGEAVNRAASAGDPWSTILPGSYGAGSAGKLMSDNLDAKVSTCLPTTSYTTPPTTVDIANAVRDVDNRTPAPNSLGAGVNAAASAGDPWATVLPGVYGANTAGSIIGTKVDVAVSSRLAANSYTAPPSLLATAQAVRDVDNTNPASNSLGAAVNSAASAGDPWSAQIPNPAYGAGTAGKLIGDTLNATVASRLAASAYVIPPNVSQIAAATRDVDNTNPVPGSMGDKINSAASAGDPWSTVLPGAYGAGTAGALVGNNVDAKVSTRLPTSSYVQAPSAQIVAESVRDVDNTAPATNSLGAAINVSAEAGDPWLKVLPGSYAAGSAGKVFGDNIDAKISTRSTYAGTDTPGTTTLLTRVPGPITLNGGKVDVNDKTGFSLIPAYDAAKTAAQPGDAMSLTSTERTTLTSAIWQYLTSFLTTAGTVGKLLVDQLNAPVATRLAAASYVAPDNAGIASIKAKTDNIPTSPASTTDIPTAAQNAAATRDVSNATPAAGSLGADVKTGAQAVADPWASNLPGSYPAGTAGNILGTKLDANISTRLPTASITLNGGQVTVGTNNDKAGYTLASGQATAIADEVLKRDWQLVGGEATYSVLNALRFLRDQWEVQSDGTLVVYKENGQVAWTRTVKSDPLAIPITGVQ